MSFLTAALRINSADVYVAKQRGKTGSDFPDYTPRELKFEGTAPAPPVFMVPQKVKYERPVQSVKRISDYRTLAEPGTLTMDILHRAVKDLHPKDRDEIVGRLSSQRSTPSLADLMCILDDLKSRRQSRNQWQMIHIEYLSLLNTEPYGYVGMMDAMLGTQTPIEAPPVPKMPKVRRN